jgi:hypothetical protein
MSIISCRAPSDDDSAALFFAGTSDSIQSDEDSTELIASLKRLKESRMPGRVSLMRAVDHFSESEIGSWCGHEIGRGESSVVKLLRCSDGTLIAVKRRDRRHSGRLLERESVIHLSLNHPLVP